jgi:hypothetical protein
LRQIPLYTLLQCLIEGTEYKNIQVKDGDGYFHRIDCIDLISNKISCDDGYYHYFEAFGNEGNHELYVK